MLLVKITTRGREVFESETGPTIGYDGIETFFRLVAHEDDCDQWADGEEFAKVEVLGEIEHSDVLDLFERSCAMQRDLAEAFRV